MTPKPQALPFLRWRRVIRLIWLLPLLVVSLAVTGLGILFLRSDIQSFRPRLPKIMKLVEEQRSATPKLPPFLLRCLAHEAGNDAHIARVLLSEYGLSHTRGYRWAVRWTFWRWSLKWHLSVEDRQLLYSRFMSDLDDHFGVQHVAQKLYQKPLDALDDRQLASLVVVSRSPARFMHDRALLEKLICELLNELS
jgi:hypothetical protein